MPLGATMEIASGTTSNFSFTLYLGVGNAARTFASGVTMLTYGASTIIRVRRLAQTDYSIEQIQGAAPTTSTANPPVRARHIVNAGQSNAVKLLAGGGLAGLQERFTELGVSNSIWYSNAASGSSALIHGNQAASQPDNWWWDPAANGGAGGPGPLATALVAMVLAAIAMGQPAPSVLWWDQGEQEVSAITASGATTYTTYLAAMGALFNWIRTQLSLPNLWVVITPLGADDTLAVDKQKSTVRNAQLAYIASDAHALQGPERYDLSRPAGNVHLNYAGQRMNGRRMATVLDNLWNGHSNDLGPTLVSGSFSQISATTYKVSINPGTSSASLNNSNYGIQGFALATSYDLMNATIFPIVSISRLYNGSTGYHDLTITTATDATGCKMMYPYGALQPLSRTGRILLNTVSLLPLRTCLA